MKKNKIFVACDTTKISKVKEIIKKTQNSKLKVGYKLGLEFLNSKNGRTFLSKIKNKIIFFLSLETKVLPFFEFKNSKPNLYPIFNLEFTVLLIISFIFEILELSQATNILFFFIIQLFKHVF